jgi:subfamily B ATP-binding cassette protein MsbA
MPEKVPKLSGRFVRDWLAPQWRWFALGAAFAAVSAACAYGYGEIVQRATNWLEALDPRVYTLAPLVIIGLVLIRGPALYWQTQANNIGVQRAMVEIQHALFGKLMSGDFARLQASASGEYVSQFANDATLIREASLRVATNLAKSTLTILACVIFMFVKDWPLALLLLVAYPIAFYPVVKLGDRIRGVSRRAQEQAGALTSFLGESFQGARTVKAFGLEEYQHARARAGFQERARLYMKVLRSKAVVDPLLEVFGGLALAGVFAFAGWRAINGQATVGELVGFITMLAIAAPEVRALGTLNSAVNEGLAAATRIYAVVDAKPKVTDRPGAIVLDKVEGRIAFEDVHFRYGDDPTLNGLTFETRPGQTIALVGPSGAGKTTVFNMLLRLYDVGAGTVRLDGKDIRDVTLASLRRNLALVSQDAFMFDATIRQNIALARPGATDDQIKAAAAAAACDFIDTLPGGWEAPAGEGGRNLSGGQRQRIALARALLSDAPVLLLDEATSALDSANEAKVQQAIAALAGKRTIIVIAHRLSTVRRADRIYFLDHGQVTESGTHDELMAKNGGYARLAAHQLT